MNINLNKYENNEFKKIEEFDEDDFNEDNNGCNDEDDNDNLNLKDDCIEQNNEKFKKNKKAKQLKKHDYSSDEIIILEGLEGVIQNPGMYIGDVESGKGLHKMLYEIFDNAKDEIASGCNMIEIIIFKNNSVFVSDNGRGIPVDIHKKALKPTVEVVMTNLHAGGKFKGEKAGGAYEKTGGLHGVGASVVNALSSFMDVFVYRDNNEYRIGFENGVTTKKLEIITKNPKKKSGTNVVFLPSDKIFGNIFWNAKEIISEIKESAFLNPGVKFFFKDERDFEDNEFRDGIIFHYQNGINDYILEHINELNIDLKNTTEESIISGINPVINFSGIKNDIQINCAFLWANISFDHEDIICFTNGIKQLNGGTHLNGFRSGIAKSVLHYIDQNAAKKEKASVIQEDIREGLIGIVCVKIHHPKFSSQTKEVLINKEVKSGVEDFLEEKLSFWLDSNPNHAKMIMSRVLLSSKAREAAKRARDTKKNEKNIFENNILPGKLASCQTKNPEEAELFIVEGNSAGGSAKQGRNRENQAILALRGKILNVEKVKYEKMITSAEICALITAIGAGIGRNFDSEKIKYHKIIIMTDADVDGYHIRTLLLTFFFRYMSELIEKGYLYVAQPPLYKIKIGQKESYIKNDEYLKEYLIDHFLNNNSIFIFNEKNNDFDRLNNDLLYLKLDLYEKIYQFILNSSQSDLLITEIVFFSIVKNNIKNIEDFEFLNLISIDLSNYFGFEHKATIIKDQQSGKIFINIFYIIQNVNHNIKIDMSYFLSGKIEKSFMTKNNSNLYEEESELLINSDDESINNFIDNSSELFSLLKSGFSSIDYFNKTSNFVKIKLKNDKIINFNTISSFIFGFQNIIKDGLIIQRFKGLGEMNPDQLWKTAMDPKNRQLLQINIEDAKIADETFSILMGDNVELRREFIENSEYLMDEIDT